MGYIEGHDSKKKSPLKFHFEKSKRSASKINQKIVDKLELLSEKIHKKTKINDGFKKGKKGKVHVPQYEEVCEDVITQKCTDIPYEDCQPVEEEKCISVPVESCKDAEPVTACEDVPKEECSDVEESQCEDV